MINSIINYTGLMVETDKTELVFVLIYSKETFLLSQQGSNQ